MVEFVGIEITKPLPEQAVAGSTYKIEGVVKIFDAVGAPPWVYAQVQHKEWYKPDWAEKVDYLRAWPVPIAGDFSIEFKPEKEGEYQVTVVATPAPLPLPVAGVFPILAESDAMQVSVGQRPPAVFRFSGVTIDGNKVSLTNHDADSKLLIQKKTTDSLEIIPSFEWVGPRKTATISIKAGYKDWAGNFTPKTDAYTATIELPESPDTPYSGVGKAITVPLTACGDLSDGAIEIVAKLPGMPDYISQIWNVFATKPAVVSFRFSAIIIDGKTVSLGNHDTDSGLLLAKTTADSLSVIPAFEWQGSKKSASISIKAGYRDWSGGFTPKTDAYTATFELPDSIDKKYSGQLTSPITVPLTACGGLTDGAIEVVLKISGFSDYISHIWNVYVTKAPEEELGFDLTRPTVSQTPVAPGKIIDITCPVKSTCAKAVDAIAKVIIYEGSLAPGHGTKIKDYDSGFFRINPGEAKEIVVHHTTVAGTIDRRDVEVEVYVDTQLVKESEWDDVFYVGAPPEEVVDFDLTRPSVSPAEITPGTAITITCPVKSDCTKEQTATAKVLIYEGSIYAGHGTLIATKTSPAFSIAPGQTYNVIVHHTTIAGTIDRRDVEVEIYIGSKLVKESEWDDVYYVKKIALQTLEVDITPTEGGYVKTNPAPETGPTGNKWYNGSTGQFKEGTRVQVTAYPNSGYEFEKWSDEIEGGVSYSNPAYVAGTMTEHRAVKAHFRKIITYTLTVNINPSGGGTVTKSPSKTAYTEGESVSLTAKPASGYEFDHWSGDASGSSPTVSLYMNSNKTVTANFKLIVTYTLTVTIDPYGGGTVSKSPNKTTYTKGEYVTLTATPAYDYDFVKWSGDVTGYSASVTVVMDKNKSVVANFKKKLPDPYTKVTFTVKGDGFPFLTSYWKLYHYGIDGGLWQDYLTHKPGDIITVRNVTSQGKLSCFCCSSVTGEWSEQKYSREFLAEDGEDYRYDIASGIVYYR